MISCTHVMFMHVLVISYTNHYVSFIDSLEQNVIRFSLFNFLFNFHQLFRVGLQIFLNTLKFFLNAFNFLIFDKFILLLKFFLKECLFFLHILQSFSLSVLFDLFKILRNFHIDVFPLFLCWSVSQYGPCIHCQ